MNEEFKVFIKHGIYKIETIFSKEDITYRNTDRYFPIPLKFRETLRTYYYRWFYVNKSIKWYNRRVRVKGKIIDKKIEFTIAHCPDAPDDIMVITLCHPFLDQFERKEGVKWVRKRMKEALIHPHVKVWWKWTLGR